MSKILNLTIFVTILFVPLTWTIYVPEYNGQQLELKGGEYLNKKQAINELPKSANKYLIEINDNDDSQQSLTTASEPKTNAHQLLHTPLHHTSYDIDDDVAKAKYRTTNEHIAAANHENLEAQPTGLIQQKQLAYTNNDVVLAVNNEETSHQDSYSTLTHTRQKRQLSDFLIAPNTRWCGRGNTANGTYNHLGGATMADKCCRTHDHCKVYIPAMSNRFELFNYRPYTLSHCNCDRRFRTCLKMASDEDSNTIGKLFFNLVQTQCFILIKERVCQQRASDGTCAKEHVKQKAYLRNNKKY